MAAVAARRLSIVLMSYSIYAHEPESTGTTNVDALQDQCRDLTGTVTAIEPFGDHNALVTLANTAVSHVNRTNQPPSGYWDYRL